MPNINIRGDEKDFFFKEGYLVLENILDEWDLQPVIDEIGAEIDNRARKLLDRGEISQLYANEP